MTYFEYEAVYFGIIVGLALSNILTSFHKLVEAGGRVRWGWLAPLSAGYAATMTLGEFWYVWAGQHGVGAGTFLSWLLLALAFALLFLMCAAALPDEIGESGIDLGAYYTANRHRFWGFSTALHVFNLMTWTIGLWKSGFDGRTIHDSLPPMLANGLEGALSLTLIFVRAKWWQVLVLVGLWAFTLFFFGPMQIR